MDLLKQKLMRERNFRSWRKNLSMMQTSMQQEK